MKPSGKSGRKVRRVWLVESKGLRSHGSWFPSGPPFQNYTLCCQDAEDRSKSEVGLKFRVGEYRRVEP